MSSWTRGVAGLAVLALLSACSSGSGPVAAPASGHHAPVVAAADLPLRAGEEFVQL